MREWGPQAKTAGFLENHRHPFGRIVLILLICFVVDMASGEEILAMAVALVVLFFRSSF